MAKTFCRFIFLKLMGWKIVGRFDPSIKKSVLMVMPHTSWHDFYIGVLTRGAIGLEMHYVAKKELFRFPFGWLFRWLGGAPLDRTGNRNSVDAIADIFNNRKVFRMAIAPEGTRQKVDKLKTGFYFIALQADVPIIPVAFDYSRKEVRIGPPFHPTGDLGHDLESLLGHFTDARGKIPSNELSLKNFRLRKTTTQRLS